MNQKESILTIIRKRGWTTTKNVAEFFKISRARAHVLLHQLREEGEVVLIGKTNTAKYFIASDHDAVQKAKSNISHIFLRLKNKNLSEDAVFTRIENETGILIDVQDNIKRIFQYAFTEMLNNAIDHSRSERIEIECRKTSTALVFNVRDYGIGI